jgi:hypothetical protein
LLPLLHSHVTHSKLPELGVGEILTSDGDRISIRFASGERNFVWALVSPHLTVTTEAVPPPPGKARASRAKKAAAAAAAK